VFVFSYYKVLQNIYSVYTFMFFHYMMALDKGEDVILQSLCKYFIMYIVLYFSLHNDILKNIMRRGQIAKKR
jgi:hypothetical protein